MVGAAPPSPGAGAGGFPSPHLAAHPHVGMDAIEDMLLDGLDGHEATSSPNALLARTLDAAVDAPSGGKKEPDVSGAKAPSAAKDTNYSLSNAVHMQLQDNAKLPTFNLRVDRSNASWKTPAPRGRRSQRGGRRGGRNRSLSSDSGSLSSGPGVHISTAAATVTATGAAAATAAVSAPLSPLPKLAPHGDDTYPGTSEHGPMDSATSRAIDDIMKLNEHDINLSEMFLDGRSKSLAYSYSGGAPLWPKPPRPMEKTPNGKANAAEKATDASANTPRYNRKIPLPIPMLKLPTPPGSQNATAAALATAAAIAKEATVTVVPGGLDKQTAAALSVQPNNVVFPVRMPGGPPQLTPRTTPPKSMLKPPSDAGPKAVNAGAFPPNGVLRPAPFAPGAKAVPIPKPGHPTLPVGARPPPPKGAVLARPPPVKPHQYPPGYPYAAQAQARARQLAAHAKTKGSIAHATTQRSKFGFGEDHRVPGVPAPPPSVKGYRAGAPAPPTSAAAPDAANLNSGSSVIAYERKKQRAKDARSKMNEAIEELAVAIDLAGSQSKERFNFVTKTTGTNSGHITNGQPPSGPPQHPLARLMDETIQQASQAKKWDRPAFVGLSANVIHSLNAQCEGLMREVAQLRKLAIANGTAPAASPSIQSNAALINGVHSQPNGVTADVPGQAAKRQKVDSDGNANQLFHAATLSPSGASQVLKDQQTRLVIHLGLETPNVLKKVASFLDPKSLSRCLCTSKRWRVQNIFQNPDLWLDLCIKRFGASATRKWQDADENHINLPQRKNVVLYRTMNGNNVRPYCPNEGSLFLGGASLDGLVACWVSLMDRSNGETSRSVKQSKGETRQCYASLPVVELRILVQNTGYANGAIVIPDQEFSVDASTRRKGEKMLEVDGDDRFKRQVLHIERRQSIDGKPDSQRDKSLTDELCRLRLFDCAIIAVHIHARGCSTTTKFCQRSKKTQLLVSIDGTTRPIAVPFCANEHPLKPSFH